jgi:hypothetical protein
MKWAGRASACSCPCSGRATGPARDDEAPTPSAGHPSAAPTSLLATSVPIGASGLTQVGSPTDPTLVVERGRPESPPPSPTGYRRLLCLHGHRKLSQLRGCQRLMRPIDCSRPTRALGRCRHRARGRPRRPRRAPPGGDGRVRSQHFGRCERGHGGRHHANAKTRKLSHHRCKRHGYGGAIAYLWVENPSFLFLAPSRPSGTRRRLRGARRLSRGLPGGGRSRAHPRRRLLRRLRGSGRGGRRLLPLGGSSSPITLLLLLV